MDINLNVNGKVNLELNVAPALVKLLEMMGATATHLMPTSTLGEDQQPVATAKSSRTSRSKHKTEEAPAEDISDKKTTEVTLEEPAASAVEVEEEKSEVPDKKEAEPAANEKKGITIEQVRDKLTSLSRAGKVTEVRELIAEFGVKKLTDIPADKYAEVLAKAGEIE